MERSVFEIVKAPMGWSVFADNIKIGGVYDSRSAALEAAARPRPVRSATVVAFRSTCPARRKKSRDGPSRSTSLAPSCRRGTAASEAAHGKAGVKAIARL
jgi:hypothetical protein